MKFNNTIYVSVLTLHVHEHTVYMQFVVLSQKNTNSLEVGSILNLLAKTEM